MGRNRNTRGITLLELLVVLVLIALIAAVAGPAIGKRLDSLLLQRTASEVAAQFRNAGAKARVSQTPIAAVYADHEFQFIQNTKPVAHVKLPGSIEAESENQTAFLLLPSGQVAGSGSLQLRDQGGRQVTIRMDFLDGIRIEAATTK